jgi:hypothetical protein
VHRTSVWVDGRDWTGTVTLPRAPVELRVDPEGWLLFRDAGVTRVGQEE